MTSRQRRIDTTLYKRHVSAGYMVKRTPVASRITWLSLFYLDKYMQYVKTFKISVLLN